MNLTPILFIIMKSVLLYFWYW